MTADVNQAAAGQDGTAQDGKPPSSPNARRLGIASIALAAATGVVIAAVFAFVVTGARSGASRGVERPADIPASISTSLAAQMQLSPVPPKPAPGFTLTDQNGKAVSLASFAGKTVVLTFMDPHCTDICPIVSREFIDAKKDLGAAASRVVFVAVNVNPYHNAVPDVAAFSRAERLDSIGTWYFLTGPVSSLRTVWNEYQIEVLAKNRNADVVHTSLVYFIDPRGRERYVVVPIDDHTKGGTAFLPAGQLASWSKGIALLAKAAG